MGDSLKERMAKMSLGASIGGPGVPLQMSVGGTKLKHRRQLARNRRFTIAD